MDAGTGPAIQIEARTEDPMANRGARTGDKGDGNAELPRRREPASYGHDEREACGGSGRPNRIEADGPDACPDGRDGMRLFGEASAPPGAIESREKRWRRRLQVASA